MNIFLLTYCQGLPLRGSQFFEASIGGTLNDNFTRGATNIFPSRYCKKMIFARLFCVYIITMSVILHSESTVVKKYPFIEKFVKAMSSMNAPEYITRDIDLKSLIYFFVLYTNVCRSLSQNKQELSEEKIINEMNLAYSSKQIPVSIVSEIFKNTDELLLLDE